MPEPSPPGTVAEALRIRRSHSFVGRRSEIDLFLSAVYPGDSPLTLLWFHGPGGVGKSALLMELRRRAADLRLATRFVDGREHLSSPDDLLGAMGDIDSDPSLPTVVFIDSFERLQHLEHWLRDTFVPSRPVGSLTVVASRSPPSHRWREDQGWRDLLRV
ncbi:MAG: ATP-binding protein, partial [Acidimicrobiia bacterium]|nr:ATP-binding protein [Acidimicrobiia bacterium]